MNEKAAKWLTAVAILAVIGACNAPGDDEPTEYAAVRASSPTTSSAAPLFAAGGSTASSTVRGQAVKVARVVDGDTLELADGRRVRVLGIDSCEMSTPAGPEAKAEAEKVLQNASVTLLGELRAPDTDQYGRLLRYVSLGGGVDFGQHMVGYDHTGIYQGDNDASQERLAALKAHDLDHAKNPPAGRNCGEEAPPVVAKQDKKGDDSDRKSRPAPKAEPKSKPKASGPFKNCAAARAAGAAPVHRGEPGYSSKLDRDGDGVGCE